MSQKHIVIISDLHIRKLEANNQGLVITEFFKDLKTKIDNIEKDNLWCIISGDLVQAGTADAYEVFSQKFLSKIKKLILPNHIIYAPGNHDLNRGIISDAMDEHKNASDLQEENTINAYFKQSELIKRKFKAYADFCKSNLSEGYPFDICSYDINIDSNTSVFSLNTALMSTGGLQSLPDDNGRLLIETSRIYEWINRTEGLRRILVMHHPTNFLAEKNQKELEGIIRKHIDIVIFGHVHDQETSWREYSVDGNQREILYFQAPQLFSDKHELNGYAILSLSEEETNIDFREWSTKRYKFHKGFNFADNDDGIIVHKSKKKLVDDVMSQQLQSDLDYSMEIMGFKPDWEERKLDTEWNNHNVNPTYYNAIVNSDQDYIIRALAEYGLSCYGKYLRKKFWDIHKQHWMFLDIRDLESNRLDVHIRKFKTERGIADDEIAGVIFDNWNFSKQISQKAMDTLKKDYQHIRIVLLVHDDNVSLISGFDSKERYEGFVQYYLRELSRARMRSLVGEFNEKFHIKENNPQATSVILERLAADLEEINMSRTPTNCIHMLFAFRDDFEERPVNRSRVFDMILRNLYKDAGYRYDDELTEEDCKIIMGSLCYKLFRLKDHTFSKTSYINIVSSEHNNRYIVRKLEEVLELLVDNKIIEQRGELFKFRAIYWEYYFIAFKMYQDDECFKYMMVGTSNYLIPDIMEFYTGINPKSNEVLDILNSRIEQLISSIQSDLGLNHFNPYPNFKWNLSEKVIGKSNEELDKEIRESRLPENIKDEILDREYDSQRPFNQSIQVVMEEYNVMNLMMAIRSCSRALRNSSIASEEKRASIFKNVLRGWREIANVLMYLSPLLAKNGYGGVGGANFKLSDDFPKEFKECVSKILRMIPYNIIHWFRNDLFSDKLAYLLNDVVKQPNEDDVSKHMSMLLIAEGRAKGWDDIANGYIVSKDKNSYYLGDLKSNLCYNYSIATMSDSDANKTRRLIKSCIAKHQTGVKQPGASSIEKVDDSNIPPRCI